MSEEEIAFLKNRLQEKEQNVMELEKKIRLTEFKTKKQVQEMQMLLDTEKVKFQDAEEKI